MAINVNIPSQFREYANLAAFPATGSAKILYVAKDTNKLYRWDTSVYVEVSASAASSWGSITGTLSNQTDLQSAINGKQDTLVSGTNVKTVEGQSILGSGDISITKSDVGLGNVDNTSDADKPISDATQTALNAKQNTLTLTTTGTSGAATLVGATLNIPHYSGGGSSAVINLGIGTTGTIVTGTTANTITQSISIPANTLSANNTLDVLARFSKADNVGSGNYRMYINTSNSLTGATLVATLYTISGGASIATHQNQRTFFYDGTNLTCNVAGNFMSVTDIQQFAATPFSMAYNAATNYFLIFAIQLSSATSSSVLTAYRILKYA